jgi:hypothetical protein
LNCARSGTRRRGREGRALPIAATARRRRGAIGSWRQARLLLSLHDVKPNARAHCHSRRQPRFHRRQGSPIGVPGRARALAARNRCDRGNPAASTQRVQDFGWSRRVQPKRRAEVPLTAIRGDRRGTGARAGRGAHENHHHRMGTGECSRRRGDSSVPGHRRHARPSVDDGADAVRTAERPPLGCADRHARSRGRGPCRRASGGPRATAGASLRVHPDISRMSAGADGRWRAQWTVRSVRTAQGRAESGARGPSGCGCILASCASRAAGSGAADCSETSEARDTARGD